MAMRRSDSINELDNFGGNIICAMCIIRPFQEINSANDRMANVRIFLSSYKGEFTIVYDS